MVLQKYLRSTLVRAFEGFLRDAQRELTMHVERSIDRVTRNIKKQIFSGLFVMLALVFLLLSLLFFFIDYIGINNSFALLLVGIAALIIGLIIKFI